MENTRVPEGVIERLSSYLRCLITLRRTGKSVISSQKLSMCARVNPAQIRRDLSYFGSFGRRGLGYDVEKLIDVISDILDIKRVNEIALVGMGQLGSALMGYSGLQEQGFKISYVFDNDSDKVGRRINGVRVRDIKDIQPVLTEKKIRIGIIAVPGEAAQKTADTLIQSGVKILLNYASTPVTVPEDIQVHTSDPARELLHTLYYMTRVSKSVS